MTLPAAPESIDYIPEEEDDIVVASDGTKHSRNPRSPYYDPLYPGPDFVDALDPTRKPLTAGAEEWVRCQVPTCHKYRYFTPQQLRALARSQGTTVALCEPTCKLMGTKMRHTRGLARTA